MCTALIFFIYIDKPFLPDSIGRLTLLADLLPSLLTPRGDVDGTVYVTIDWLWGQGQASLSFAIVFDLFLRDLIVLDFL